MVFLCGVDVLVSEDHQMAVQVFKKNLTICVNLRAGREREICLFYPGGPTVESQTSAFLTRQVWLKD